MILFIFWGKHSDGSMEDGQVGKGEENMTYQMEMRWVERGRYTA